MILRRWNKFIIAALTVCGVLLCGCGRGGGPKDAGRAEKGAEMEDRRDFDWRSEKIRLSEDVAEGTPFQLAAYIPFAFPEPEGRVKHLYSTGAACGDEVCYMLAYLMADQPAGADAKPEESRAQVYQYLCNVATGEEKGEEVAVDPNYTGEVGSYCSLTSLIGVTEDALYFYETDYACDEETNTYTLSSYQVIKTDRQRKILDRTEIIEGYRQLGMIEPYEGAPLYPGDCIVSPDGSFYILRNEGNALCRVDGGGNAHMIVDYGINSIYSVTVGSAWDGTPLFVSYNADEGCAEMFCADGETGQKKVLSKLPKTTIRQFFVNRTGLCYYIDLNEKIVRWDMATGERAEIYDLRKAGFTNSNWMEMKADRDGTLWLYLMEGAEKAAVKLDTRGAEQEVILKFYMDYEASYFSSCAASFSRKHPGVTIEIEYPSSRDEREACFTRMKADVMSGQGPDMFLLDDATMRLFWEKGALAGMGDMVDPDAKKQIWPILLESGKIDGQLAGLATGYVVSTMFVANDVWAGDTWTVADVLDLLERKDAPETFCALYFSESDSPETVLRYLALGDLEHSPFLDLEKGECHFDSRDFVRALEVAKRYGHLPAAEDGEDFRMVRNGEALVAMPSRAGNLSGFSDAMAKAGEEIHPVGLPTESGGGNFLYVYSYFCVNKTSPHQDIAEEFISYFLQKENQRKNGSDTILRRDVLEENVMKNPAETNWTIYMGDGNYALLPMKQDGTSYLEEYYEWMDRLEPEPVVPEEIFSIISEEAEPFFGGGRSAEDAAELIQNRVRLYLDERK